MKKAVLTFICFVIMLGAIGAATIDRPYEGIQPADIVCAQVRTMPQDKTVDLDGMTAATSLVPELLSYARG